MGDDIAKALESLKMTPTKPVGTQELRAYRKTICELRRNFTFRELAKHLSEVFGRPVLQHTVVNLLRSDRNEDGTPPRP